MIPCVVRPHDALGRLRRVPDLCALPRCTWSWFAPTEMVGSVHRLNAVRVGSEAVANWAHPASCNCAAGACHHRLEGFGTAPPRVVDDPGAVRADVAVRRDEPVDLPLGVLGGPPPDRAGGTCGPIRR